MEVLVFYNQQFPERSVGGSKCSALTRNRIKSPLWTAIKRTRHLKQATTRTCLMKDSLNARPMDWFSDWRNRKKLCLLTTYGKCHYPIQVAHASLCDTVDSQAAHAPQRPCNHVRLPVSIMEDSQDSQFHRNMTVYLKTRGMVSLWSKKMRWKITQSIPSYILRRSVSGSSGRSHCTILLSANHGNVNIIQYYIKYTPNYALRQPPYVGRWALCCKPFTT